ncbi:MAG: 16S rRNA (guanine(966)-N(2))-methyltransferase RsmD [Actinobacteria bacterium]|nr:16S rRNA (guanine(966)-N(2))-methyltransferase RsmD [Actinomycetota bacterium]
MTRIIAGTAKGRRLKVPDTGTRPTADRVRESLFNILEHRYDGLDGVSVADLYAGSGALGLEAASRGAAPVVLVENDRAAAAVIASNIETAHLPAHVSAMDVKVWVSGPAAAHAPYDIVFLDPPYTVSPDTVMSLVASMAQADLLADECDVLYECAKPRKDQQACLWPAGFKEHQVRAYGDTQVRHGVWYGQVH